MVKIAPLPQFEADLAEQKAIEEDRLAYERLNAPKTMVIKHGLMAMIAELPYGGDAKPGCGSKVVATTTRGTELGEMLTSTCPNSGCSKSVTRKEMLDYIDRSGGRNYPFSTKGRILRIATKEDLDAQAKIEADRSKMRSEIARIALEHAHTFKVVEAEAILGGEQITVYIASEHRVEAREFTLAVERHFQTRVTIRAVGARDEARLTADYERCGQYCCCKNFLKVLKPVSMRSAKQQKATLEPLKISGRCGRLMCCLRYEDSTYQELKKNLPNRKTHVGTPEGDGIVIDSQILTQLVLVELDGTQRTRVAIAVEDLTEPGLSPPPPRSDASRQQATRGERDRRPSGRREGRASDSRDSSPSADGTAQVSPADETQETSPPSKPRSKRRRRRRKRGASGEAGTPQQAGTAPAEGSTPSSPTNAPSGVAGGGGDSSQQATGDGVGAPRKKRRRRRRRRGSSDGPPPQGGSPTQDGGPQDGSGPSGNDGPPPTNG